VSGQAFVVLPAILVAHWVGRRRAPTRALVVRDLAVAAATTVACALATGDGFGWIGTVSKQFAAHPPFSAASGVAKVLAAIVRGASYDDLAAGARITTVTAMVCVLAYLLVTTRHRPFERTAGYSLLALALLAPVLYPWYLLWGVLCVAPSASRNRRVTVLAMSAAGCVLVPPGFAPLTANVITGCALASVLLVAAAAWSGWRPSVAGGARRAALPTRGDVANGGAHVGEVDERDDGGDERDGVERRARPRAEHE
jgi:hypothetical protein